MDVYSLNSGNSFRLGCWLALLVGASGLNAQEDVWDPQLFPSTVFREPSTSCQPCAHDRNDAQGLDFSVPTQPQNFPACPQPNATWCGLAGDTTCEPYSAIPAIALRNAVWYVSGDLVSLTHDAQHKRNFTRLGSGANAPFVLTSQGFDYPLDAGANFTLGRRLGDRLAVEAGYLGSYGWRDSRFVRNTDANSAGGTGNLASPFTNFGSPNQVQGFDFNNFAQIETTSRFENAEINLRYRPEMACSQWDVSFLYGVRYIHIDDSLRYHAESSLPAVLGAQNTEFVATDNDMVGAQLGLSGHYLLNGKCWFDLDLKGALLSNRARQTTVYDNVDNLGAATSVTTTGSRNDSAFSGDIRLLWNYQLLPQFTIRTGYQVTWVTSVATGVDNFQTDVNALQLGPGIIRTEDTITYHGPVLGVQWVR